jgi:chromate transporter
MMLGELALRFMLLSMVAVGGGATVLPDMQRMAEAQGWLDPATFASYYALTQCAPGPNILVVALVGLHVAGIAGALAASAGMLVPSSILAYFAAAGWVRFGDAPWRKQLAAALLPVVGGLVIAAGVLIAEAAALTWVSFAITAAVALLSVTTRVNLLLLLVVAAAVGALAFQPA